jgi:hypothetical protein
MAFIRTRTLKGKRYRYLQWSYRVPGRRTPKTGSIYLGPEGGGFFARNFKIEHSGIPVQHREEIWAQQAKVEAREKTERQQALDKLHDDYGLKVGPDNPTPQEKAPAASESQAPTGEQENAPSENDGGE